MSKKLFKKLSWDRAGMLLSGLCTIHCLVFPALLALMPLWSVGFVLHEWAHPILFILIVPIIVLAIKKSGGDQTVSVLLLAGLCLLALAWLMHYWVGHTAEMITTLAGSTTLIIGHWKNYKQHSAQSC
ncbi:MerC domain-containing protein [Fodinibius salsisoli]|uniref:MerC domain-containing protein n=1 Tax=Fodinibius salsisoli TaxID=2820877 RepID=A0ABT3PK21_9BACT|nr:MerC domain-containing protein [Fodinibius salsisoli]MCW9706290.1 MerC domain-containing protein [Fodinibius salsisoli]